MVVDVDVPIASQADLTGGALSESTLASALTAAELSGAYCPSDVSRQECVQVSAFTDTESNFAILEKASESNNSDARCPVCGDGMPFLKVKTDFDVPFKLVGNLSRYHYAHDERFKHVNEPLWNFLP